ncbi:MAG: SDR family oxidoreductase [Polyangiaceae bacterium]|nr:SDR family oxidoreductase [Polyangiaceae bacterium]
MSDSSWSVAELPNLQGKVIVVTGANSGIGLAAARALALAGGEVVFACRNLTSAAEAVESVRREKPNAQVSAQSLNLASLASVQDFAQQFAAKYSQLDILINNAGVMALPFGKTADGFEMQVGTNHFGHFALTGRLLPQLQKSPSARVVTVSSRTHEMGSIDFDNLQSEKGYQKWAAYSRSKLMNLLFAYELDRRLRTHRVNIQSIACHPGYAATNLQTAGPRQKGSTFFVGVWTQLNNMFAQTSENGALPTLFAAASPSAEGGDYIGPGGPFELWGAPKKVRSTARSRDANLAAQLWEVSESLTGVTYRFTN